MMIKLWSKICHNWFIKCIGAGVVALGVLSLFSIFYYNPPIHVACESGATDYTRESGTFWARATEGFAHGTTDIDGYNNVRVTKQDDIGILMMGSSQTEGLYVDAQRNMGYDLAELLQEDGLDLPVYNIGMSSHGFLRNVSNLDAALQEYKPSAYLVMETDLVDFSAEEIDAALQNRMEPLATYNEGILYQLQRIPYVKLAYQQYQNYKGNGLDAEMLVEAAVDDGMYDWAKTGELLTYVKSEADEAGVMPIIYYYPHLYLQDDGTLATSNVDTKIAAFSQICADNDIVFVNMTDDFLKEYEENHQIVSGFPNTAECYGHLNKYGHQLIAKAIEEVITEK